jgi:hypothetical protein
VPAFTTFLIHHQAWFDLSQIMRVLDCLLHLLVLLHGCSLVVAVSDGALAPPSNTVWGCAVASVIFVYLILPFWGRDGVDPGKTLFV